MAISAINVAKKMDRNAIPVGCDSLMTRKNFKNLLIEAKKEPYYVVF